jgi:hypothetical protein
MTQPESDTTLKKTQAVLRGHGDDLAGHHLILKISKEAWSGVRYMRVDRAPLTVSPLSAKTSTDPAVDTYLRGAGSLATTWGILDGWLYNLRGSMRSEQSYYRVDELHPMGSNRASNQWSCPLKRVSFWSRVAQGFSPLVPSPGRNARLFGEASGRNMLHGTRSHPTQMFASLYDKLANVVTSNGFCYCVRGSDCQIDGGTEPDAGRRECSLLETIRSMYDGRFRQVRHLTGASTPACAQQLDWPFVGGWMRDLSQAPARYTEAQARSATDEGTCNVLDRLPPFQYR